MVTNFDFDIVAHFDRILWRAAILGIEIDLQVLESDIRAAFTAIIRYGRGLELNTTHLGDELDWSQPLMTMLGWYREEGGREVVVNSDAHRASETGRHRQLAQQILASVDLGLARPLGSVAANSTSSLLPPPAGTIAPYQLN